MTRSFRRIGALCASTVAAVSFAAAAPAHADNGDGFTFTLYAKQVPPPTTADESNPPIKVGDTPVFAYDLYKTKGGETVGRNGVSCAVVRVSGDQVDMNCVETFVLNGGPGGQLAAQVLTTFDTTNESLSGYDIAVTGGTGDFTNARGYIRSTPDGDYARLEFHINAR